MSHYHNVHHNNYNDRNGDPHDNYRSYDGGHKRQRFDNNDRHGGGHGMRGGGRGGGYQNHNDYDGGQQQTAASSNNNDVNRSQYLKGKGVKEIIEIHRALDNRHD